jgi:hypothetical protein
MTSPRAVDPDFAEEVLSELYEYRPKNRWLAWLLWGVLGILGVHRLYLERPVSGLIMLFTGGGMMMWWFVDAFLLPSMLREYAAEQERRREAGQPPIELAFMPTLDREVLSRPPEWTERWHARSPSRRAWRLVGDVLVLCVSGLSLAVLAKHYDTWEAVGTVLVLVVLVAAGGTFGRWSDLPVLRTLLRWSHRLRLFYYFNEPGSPPALLMRAVTATITAPFRSRHRAEVRLYMQLGLAFTIGFLVLDFGGEVLAVLGGGEFPSVAELLTLWATEAVTTFVIIFGFATPIGAVITLHLLVSPTHALPRRLSALVAGTVLLGLIVI